MAEALRAELLKARSGFWMLAVLLYVLLLPPLVWRFAGGGELPLPGPAGTEEMLAYLAVCPLGAAFLGAFLVTREYYYGSISRTVLAHRKQHSYLAKCVAGVLGGLAVGVVGVLGWGGFTWSLLGSLYLSGAAWATVLGTLLACALGGVLGVTTGWLLPNYYHATMACLLLPLVVEVPLRLFAPGVAHFLPYSALAGVVSSEFAGGFPLWASLFVALAWLALVGWGGWRAFVRREVYG